MDEVIRLFNTRGVRYLVIGGQAVRLEGLPRFSIDWDIYIPADDLENIAKINALLGKELDLPLVPLGKREENFVQTYQVKWGILQFHLGGAGLPKFDRAEKRSVLHKTESGTEVRCLSLPDLLAAKRKADRPRDREDVDFLERKASARKG